MRDIYFDNSATTAISEAALEVYCQISRDTFGNPSSLHARGAAAEKAVKAARESLVRALGARDGQIVFCGSGSEANNLAIFGRAGAKARFAGKDIVTTAGEHASVSQPLAKLAEQGFSLHEIPTKGGVLDLAAAEAMLSPKTVLVTVMLVNNETGALYDVASLAKLMRRRCPEAVLHCDATQAFLKMPFTVASIGADMVTVSAHKVEGPKGVGALWISQKLLQSKGIVARILGGGQEQGLRSGTENVPAIAAFGQAVEEGRIRLTEENAHLCRLQAYLRQALADGAAFGEVMPLMPSKAAPHIVTLCLPHIKSEVMLHHLSSRGICVSSGSACSSHGRHGAHPLLAFGLDGQQIDTCIRISFGHKNTEEEIDVFLDALRDGLTKLVRMK